MRLLVLVCIAACAVRADDDVPGFFLSKLMNARAHVLAENAGDAAKSLVLALNVLVESGNNKKCPLVRKHIVLVGRLLDILDAHDPKECTSFYRSHARAFARLKACADHAGDPVLAARTTELLDQLDLMSLQ